MDAVLRGFTLIGLVGAGATLALSGNWTIPAIVGGVAALAGVAAAIYSLVTYHSDKAVLSKVMSGQFFLLSTEWKRLYRELRESASSPDSVIAQAVLLEKMQAMVDAYADQCGWLSQVKNTEATKNSYEYLAMEFPSIAAGDTK